MKIIPSAYPECYDASWISFTKGPEISRVFLYRLAAYVRDHIGKPASVYGFRTYAEQLAAYNNYLAGGNLAAKPGTSWHEFGLAVDFNRIATINGKGDYPGTIDEDYQRFASGQPEVLNQYGLTHTVKGEPWHIQPIETKGYTGVRSAFLDADDEMNGGDDMKRGDNNESVKAWQSGLNATLGTSILVDGNFGGGTETATKQFQSACGIDPSGVVGDVTFAAMLRELLKIPDIVRAQMSQELETVKADRDNLAIQYDTETRISAEWAQTAANYLADLKQFAQLEAVKQGLVTKYINR